MTFLDYVLILVVILFDQSAIKQLSFHSDLTSVVT